MKSFLRIYLLAVIVVIGFAIIDSNATGNSTDGTVLNAGTAGSLVTSAGTWKFSSSIVSSGNKILLNGKLAANGSGILILVYNSGKLYVKNKQSVWYVWNGSGWSGVTIDPRNITLSSIPTNLAGAALSFSQVNLTWKASTGSVAGYKVFRNAIQIGTSVGVSYSDSGLGASKTYTYTVAAYDGGGNTSAQSTSVSVTTPALVNSPDGTVLRAGTSTSLVTSAGLWTFSSSTGSGGYMVLLNGSSAANGSATLMLVYNSGKLYVKNNQGIWYLWNGSGWTVLSTAPLALNIPPSITTQPTNATVTVPATASFSVTATGTPAPTYQWMQSVNGGVFTNILGATTSFYTTSATTTTNSGTQYKCVISNTAGSVTSNAARLTVNGATPVVSLSANSGTYLALANVTLTATASEQGGTISRVDFYNGSNKLGSASSSLYTYQWSNVSAGNYTLTAQAFDSNGLSATSSAISVNVIAANGTSSQFSYDIYGQLVGSVDPFGNMTFYAYDANGNLTKMTLPGGRTTTYSYDSLGHRTGVTDGLNNTTVYAYDNEGQVVSATSPRGLVTRYAYTPNGKISTITLPDNKTITYAFDAMDNLVTVTDQNGKVLRHTFNTVDALHLGKNLLTSVVDPKANPATVYSYDALDRLTKVTDPAGAQESFALDQQGIVTSHTDAMSQQTAYTYDKVYRLIQINYGNVSSLFSWDLNGRLVQMNDTSGLTQYAYDKLNHVKTLTYPDNRKLQYTYDADGRLIQEVYPAGLVVGYGYNANGDLASITKNGSTLVQYTYDAVGRVITKILMTNPVLQTSYTYDNDSRLTSLITNKMSASPVQVSNYTYTYDANGNITTLTTPSEAYTYQYDPTHQVTAVSGSQTHIYAYDAAGNRTTVDGSAYTANTLNQYSKAAGKSTYAYNSNGSLISDGTFTFAYDKENRLTSVSGNGVNASYAYDGQSRRYSKIVNGSTTSFVYNGNQIIEERTLGATTQYIYGLGIDEVLWSSTGGNDYYYLSDGLGSVRQIANASGSVVQSYSYDLFGTPSVVNPPIQSRFGFTGREYDAETGLYQYRAREYSPMLGRFLQRDPIGFADDYNLYRYVRNNPLNYLDPTGLSKNDPNSLGRQLGDAWKAWTDEGFWKDPLIAAVPALVPRLNLPFWKYIGPDSNPNGGYLTRGKEPPYGKDYDLARDKLQLKDTPTEVKQVGIPWWEYVTGPQKVSGKEKYGSGGGDQYFRGKKFPKSDPQW